MNGGLASPAARRSAVPEPAPRPRREQPVRAPVVELPTPRLLPGGPAGMLTTRERMRTSFGGEGSQAGGPEAMPLLPPAAGPEPLAPEAVAPTTRARIVNRALAAPEAAPSPALVVDIAELQDRRRERQRAAEAPPPPPVAPLAPVIPLRPKPTLARPPPPPAPAESAAPARAPPEEEAPEAEPAEAIGPEVVPEGPPPPLEAAPEAAAAPTAAPTAVPGAEAEAAAPAEPEALPGAEPEAAPAVEPEAEAAPVEPEAAAAPPAGLPGVIHNPEDEPGFQAMKESARLAGTKTKAHQPGREGAATAQGASAPDPQKDITSQAAHEQEETMAAQQPGPFDPEAFKLAVKQAIEGMAPPATLEEADEFEESGKAAGATASIHGIVTGGRESSERDIATATGAPPNVADKERKTPSEMVTDRAGPPLPGVGAAAALPKPCPDWLIDLTGGPMQVEAKMAEAKVTEEQLAQANEPAFSAALDARQEVREHAATAPGEYRAHEGMVLEQGQVAAENVAASQLEGMHASRTETLGGVLGVKEQTKTKDQTLHDEIHQKILDIHERTQADVVSLLETLDTTVDTVFTAGEKAARDEFERYVDEKMRAYKADRYGGWFGDAYWLKDKFFDLPDEVNDFYRDGRANYLAAMDRLIEVIAVLVGMLLGAAQARIQTGREEVRTYVEGLPDSARKVGEDAAADLDNRFDQLASDVDSKRDELVDTIARKYVESRDELDTRIKELQEANKGLVSKAIDAVVGVIKTIYELGKLLLRVLLKAAAAIGDIIAHPIRFLENLVGAVKGGLDRFVSRIGVHLQKSLLDLLFGELGSAGITMPAQLDFAGILDLVLQVLGLTYASIRDRVVKRFGEPVVAQMEQKVEIFTTLAKAGVAGLWALIREKIADLEDLVVGKIKEYIVERVIKAGIGYIVALLNPAAAFVKACQGIYQIVMFIVERAKQIAAFVEAILDSIAAIAQGNIGGAIERVESALANGLSLAIAFLARLANLGALSEKVRSIIALVRKPITRIVDQIIFGAAQLFRRTLAFVKGKLEPRKEPEPVKPKAAELEKEPTDLDKPPVELERPEIHEPFEVVGVPHEIADDGTGRLVLASGPPTPVSDIDALSALYGQYRALPATAPQAHRTRIIRQMIVLLKANPNLIDLGAAQLGDAPNLGEVKRHGSNTGTSFRPKGAEPQFAALWEMESEHVLSRGVVSETFLAIGWGPVERPSADDDYMHTVMIYRGAADIKTRGVGADIALISAHAAELRGVGRDLDILGSIPEKRAQADAVVMELIDDMGDWGAGAVERAKRAVQTEHATNGAQRGKQPNDPKAPPDSRIDDAFRRQLVDIAEIARERMREEH